jgi:hypothetical protein
MRGESNGQKQRNGWLSGVGWVAGVGIGLVEMQMGMDYVLANVTEHASAILGWLPIIGTVVLRFCGHSAGM